MTQSSDEAIGGRLKQALRARDRTQGALAEHIGITPQAVGLWIRTGQIDRQNLIKACRWLRVSLDWVLTGAGNLNDAIGEQPPIYGVSSGTEWSAPLISWVMAGHWDEAMDTFHPGEGERTITTTKKVGPRAYALRVEGDSMENPAGLPTYPDGCIIVVDPDREAVNGSRVVVRQVNSKEATFKQLVIQGGEKYLKPLNPRYPIMPIATDTVICGVVVDTQLDQD